ncbi:MAG: phytoene desaturase family protein, partial [Gaiellaceae bacterium]
MPGRVVVVGAGLAGLAAAIRLAAAGAHVTLLERDRVPGGRAGRLVRDGYAFDTGPTVLTMPSLLEELFALAGERMSEHLRMVRLDPAYRAVFHDGSVVRVRAGLDALAAEVREVCGAPEADRLRRLAAHLETLYEAEYGDFIDRNFDSAVDLVRRPASLLRLVRLGGFRRMHALVAGFLQDWRLIRLFTFQAMYAGMSPFEALGIYAIIPYMETIAGVYFPHGGIHAVSQALADLAVRLGVDLRLGEPVEAVEVADGCARAVRT